MRIISLKYETGRLGIGNIKPKYKRTISKEEDGITTT